MSRAFEEDAVFVKLKRDIIQRQGHAGIKKFVTYCQSVPTEGGKYVTFAVWRDTLDKFGVEALTETEKQYLLRVFDFYGLNKVYWPLFVKTMVGSMTAPRRATVARAFTSLCDASGGDCASADEVRARYRAAASSEYVSPFEPVLEEAFGEDVHHSAVVSSDEFAAFHVGISGAFLNDDYFEAFVLQAWGVDDPVQPRLNDTARTWGPDGDPLQLAEPTLRASMARSEKLAFITTKSGNNEHMRKVRRPDALPSVLPRYISSMKDDYVPPSEMGTVVPDPLVCRTLRPKTSQFRLNPVAEILFKHIQARTMYGGVLGFRLLLLSRGQALTRQDLEQAAREFGVPLSPTEANILFDAARDKKERASPLRVMHVIRGPLQGYRRTVATEIWERIAKGAPYLPLATLEARYDPSLLNDVVDRRCTEEDARRRFAAAWPLGSTSISEEAFLEYYADVSPSVSSDDEFEALLRSTWHCPIAA